MQNGQRGTDLDIRKQLTSKWTKWYDDSLRQINVWSSNRNTWNTRSRIFNGALNLSEGQKSPLIEGATLRSDLKGSASQCFDLGNQLQEAEKFVDAHRVCPSIGEWDGIIKTNNDNLRKLNVLQADWKPKADHLVAQVKRSLKQQADQFEHRYGYETEPQLAAFLKPQLQLKSGWEEAFKAFVAVFMGSEGVGEETVVLALQAADRPAMARALANQRNMWKFLEIRDLYTLELEHPTNRRRPKLSEDGWAMAWLPPAAAEAFKEVIVLLGPAKRGEPH